jgi:exoribonuclease II
MWKLKYFLRLYLFCNIVHILNIIMNKYTKSRLSKYPLFPKKNSYLGLYFDMFLLYNTLETSIVFNRLGRKGGLCN